MKINIKVIANARKEEISENDGIFVVKVKAPAKDNEANIAVFKLLSKHFKKQVRIISGFKSKRKVVEIVE